MKILARLFQGPVLYIFIASVVWLLCLTPFFAGKLRFSSDAISYYDHIHFFLTNFMSGQFSLWDPYWSGGVPNEFFLRRICPYNPFFILVMALHTLGLPFLTAYMVFLAAYVIFGMSGFFLLARRVTGDSTAAFIAFGLLMFSALTTRIIDAYMLFIVVPLCWFFYFLVEFGAKPSRTALMGLTLFFMILMTTYLPFYFLIILASFVVLYLAVYFTEWRSLLGRLAPFVAARAWLIALCAGAVVLSAVPGFLFFADAGKGGISVPGRHYNTTEQHALAVQNQAEDSWAVPEEFYFSSFFSDLRRIILAIVYVPCFAFIPLGLMMGVRISRLLVFLVAWAAFLLLLTSPFASPLYAFLREKIFIFKYFRNLHFLLWFVLIPLFALIAAEAFRCFRGELERSKRGFLAMLVITVHAFFAYVLIRQDAVLETTWITLGLSLLFCLALVCLRWMRSESVMLPCLLLLVLLQPVEVFGHLMRNSPTGAEDFFYENRNRKIEYRTYALGEGKREGLPVEKPVLKPVPAGSFYYATSYYNDLARRIPQNILGNYESYKFVAYDAVEPMPAESLGALLYILDGNRNLALIDDFKGPERKLGPGPAQALRFEGPDKSFRIVKAQTDKVVVETNFSSPKFLVYNDAWHAAWRAKVNGRDVPVMRANGAFKGVFVPAGQATVVMWYGHGGIRFLNHLLLLICYTLAAVLAYRGFRRLRKINA